MNVFTMFQRAAAGHALTPAERALLRFIKVVGYAVLLNVIAACYMYTQTHQQPDLNLLAQYAVSQGAIALVTALGKYFSAMADNGFEYAQPTAQPAAPSAPAPAPAAQPATLEAAFPIGGTGFVPAPAPAAPAPAENPAAQQSV